MVAIKKIAIVLVAVLVFPLASRSGPDSQQFQTSQASLFSQSTGEALNRDFPSRDVSFLLLDARTGEILASRWQDPETPIPLGSLAKPFTALAYGQQHDFRYPTHTCRGIATGCWRPGGHGDVDLTSAIAYSCNSYFRMLTSDLTGADLSETANHFGLQAPDRGTSGAELAGLGPRWKISPLRMAHAYLALVRGRQQPGVGQILDGMARSAKSGTGAEVDRALHTTQALVKTGTAPCTHAQPAPGDGFVVALVPADDPKLLLMVRVHGAPGSHAAKTAGEMLRRIED